MSKVFRSNRKATDEDIIRMNAVGLSLATIAKTLGVHPTTVTLRLRSLNIEPADTRRTFMENVLRPLPTHVADWLSEQVGPRSEEHTSELQSRFDLVCRLLLEKKKTKTPE